jgi:hypothetical protein
MKNSKRFPYIKKINNLGQENYVPSVPITLNYGNVSVKSMGLLDTGATINVLPYNLGLELCAIFGKIKRFLYL